MPARTAACVHARWHGGGGLSTAGAIYSSAGWAGWAGCGLDPLAGRPWSRAGREPFVLGEPAAPTGQAVGRSGEGLRRRGMAARYGGAVEIEIEIEVRPFVPTHKDRER